MGINIMIVGVGGQGTLLASKILGNVALKCGYDTKVSEIHGMSQRGGSVVTYVKLGDKINSPLIEIGEADFILAFENLEALRWKEYLNKNGKMILNDQQIDPMPVIIGNEKYPENIIETLKEYIGDENLTVLDGLEIAGKQGSIKAINIVLIGVLASIMDIKKDIWVEALKETIPEKFLDINLRAFEAGYEKGNL